jgi:hypothetical protein
MLLFAPFFIALFFMAVYLCKKGEFYRDAFVFAPFGIYVWGDALILAPFWAIAAIVFYFFPPCLLVFLAFGRSLGV